jgi:hypothetical protein
VGVADRDHSAAMMAIRPMRRVTPSFRDGPKDQTSDVRLHIGESRDSGFALARAPE